MKTIEEHWVDIPNYEGLYQISDHGRVKSVERHVKRGERLMHVRERILRPCLAANGYLIVNLNNQGYKTHYIHRMLAEKFIPNPERFPCIDHINADRTDNRLENLKWCTYIENNNNPVTRKRMSDGSKGKVWTEKQWAGLSSRIKKISKKIYQLSTDGKVIAEWDSTQEASRQLGICSQTIYRCCNHPERSKTAGGFAWRYV